MNEELLKQYFEYADSLGFITTNGCKIFSDVELEQIQDKRFELFGYDNGL